MFKFVLFFCFGFISFYSSAQSFLQLGASLNFLDNNNVFESNRPLFGYEIRYGRVYYFGDRLSIQPEVAFNFKRISRRVGGAEFVYRWNYLALSGMAFYKVSDPLRLGVGIEGSGRVAFNLSNEIDNKIIVDKEALTSFDMGLFFIVEYALSKKIRTTLSYNFGLLPLIKYREIGNYGDVGSIEKTGKFRSVNLGGRIYFNQ